MCSGQRSRQASAPSPRDSHAPGLSILPKRSCAWTGPGRQRRAVSGHVGGVNDVQLVRDPSLSAFCLLVGGRMGRGMGQGSASEWTSGCLWGTGARRGLPPALGTPPGPPGRLPEPRFCSHILPRSRPLRCSAPKCVSRVPPLLPGGLTHSAARGLVSRGGGGPWLSPARAEQGAGTWQSAVAEGGPGPAGRAPCWALSAWLSVGAAPGSVLGPAPKAQPSGGEMPRASLLTDGLGA